MKRIVLLLVLIGFLSFISKPIWGDAMIRDFLEGSDAYARRDYITAMEKLKPIASGKNASDLLYIKNAQFFIGNMYREGFGVPRNYKEAFKWYILSAVQGGSLAQKNLGDMYYHGEGPTKDYIQSYKWYAIAMENGYKTGIKNKDIIENKMTVDQINEAKELASEWMGKYK